MCLSKHTTTSSVGFGFFFNSASHTNFCASNISFPSFVCRSLPTFALPLQILTALLLFLVAPAPLHVPLPCSCLLPAPQLPCSSSYCCASAPLLGCLQQRQEVLLKKGKVTLHAPCQKCFSYPAASLEKMKGDVQRVSQQENIPSAGDGCGVLVGAGGFHCRCREGALTPAHLVLV